MNLLFRLLWVMIRARFGARHTSILAPAFLKFRVWLTDQDMFLHMTNSRYLSFSDLGRVDLFTRSGLRKVIMSNGWRLEICGQTMTINRMLQAPKPFKLETQIHGWDDRFLVLGQKFMRNDKNHAGVVTLLAIQNRSGEPIAPQTLVEHVAPGAQSPELAQTFAELITSTKASRAANNK
nr:acyl-CoA thioesterase [Hyphomonas sp. Mor2]